MGAFRVSEEVQLIAGYAKPRSLARSSISLYTSGVAMGMMALLVRGPACRGQYLPRNRVRIPRVLDRSTGGAPPPRAGRAPPSVGLALHQGAQALVLLPAGQAAGQVGPEPGEVGVGVLAGQLQLDVAVQLGEAVVAAQLRLLGPEQPVHQTHLRLTSSPASSPALARWARSLRRASWIVLYSAPLVVPRRSASTSSGTRPATTVSSTSRWWGVSTSATPARSAASSSACSAAASGRPS